MRAIRPGALAPLISIRWTWTVPRWLGSTCGAIRHIARIGLRPGAAVSRRFAGGCDVAEDPTLDARDVHPLWVSGTEDLVHVRPTGAHSATANHAFHLWRIPGRKRLVHTAVELILTAENAPHRLRASLSIEQRHGAPYGVNAHPRMPTLEYKVQASMIHGEAPPPAFRAPTRAGLLHLHALQALDAAQAGARHRDIAEALFGAETVKRRWSADSELRMKIRHLLSRAEGLMRGGYLALAGVRHWRAPSDGDE